MKNIPYINFITTSRDQKIIVVSNLKIRKNADFTGPEFLKKINNKIIKKLFKKMKSLKNEEK